MSTALKSLLCAIVLGLAANPAHAAADSGMAGSSAVTAQPVTESRSGIEMVYVKGGCYQMGDRYGDGNGDERPVHEVCVSDFYIGKYEVTRGQWKAVMGRGHLQESDCRDDDCPVDSISWNDAQEFVSALNSRNPGGKYRLPTEAEWEYAARGRGGADRYSGGNDADSNAWYNVNSGGRLRAAGTRLPNGLGIHDMNGNAVEWVNDWYEDDYYERSPRTNPQGPEQGDKRVIRGGDVTSSIHNVRVSVRYGRPPEARKIRQGFRLARTP